MSTTKTRKQAPEGQPNDPADAVSAAERWHAINEEVQHMRVRLGDLEKEAAQARQQRITEAAAALAEGKGAELPERTTERKTRYEVDAADIHERIAALEKAAVLLAAPAMEELHAAEEAELERIHARAVTLTQDVCSTWQRLNQGLVELGQLHGLFNKRREDFNRIHRDTIGTPAPWRIRWPVNLGEIWVRIRGAASTGSIGQYRNTRPLTVEAVLYPHAQNAAKAEEEQV